MPNQFIIDININGATPPSQDKIQSGVKEVSNNTSISNNTGIIAASTLGPKVLDKTWSGSSVGYRKDFESQLKTSYMKALTAQISNTDQSKITEIMESLKKDIANAKPYSRNIDRVLGGNRMWKKYVNSNDILDVANKDDNMYALDLINKNLTKRISAAKIGAKAGAAVLSGAATFAISNMGTLTNDEVFTNNLNSTLSLAGSVGVLFTNPILGGISLALTTATKAYQYAVNVNKENSMSQRNMERLGLVRAKGGR